MFSSILVRDHTNRQSMMFSAALNFDYEFHPQVNALFQLRHYRIWNNDIVPFIRPDGSVLQSFSVNQFYSSFRFSSVRMDSHWGRPYSQFAFASTML